MNLTRLFDCGIKPKYFQEMLENLSSDDQELLSRVADRAWVTLIMRYNINIEKSGLSITRGNFGIYQLSVNELPSIELYLLFSCIDTLAGQNRKQFNDWLDDQDLEGKKTKDDIKQLYRKFKCEHGVTRNLRKLFQNLPDATKSWLYRNIKIIKLSESKNGLDQQINLQKFIQRLFKYFYFRRNSFTHRSKSISTNIANEIYDPDLQDIWLKNWPIFLDDNKPNQKWFFKYRSSLDEATILRVILHSAILQKLGIHVDDHHIHAHMLHLSRLNSFYAYKNETISNSFYLESLGKLFDEEQLELQSRILYNDSTEKTPISRK